MTYQRDNAGTIWRVDKGDNPKRPDWRGQFMINGQAYVVAGWRVSTESDRETVSLRIEPADLANMPYQPRPPKPPSPQKAFRFGHPNRRAGPSRKPRVADLPAVDLVDDEIPF